MKKLYFLSVFAIMLASCSGKQSNETSAEFPNDPFRPQIHFSPKEAWMNDPNGMVYYDGEYHLFYQYYPDSTVWGPMHWGHAVSPDMVHWEHLPIALYPDDLGYIFSGSAIVDWDNTSGLQDGEHPPMIAIFTHHEPKGASEEGNITYQYQSIAYSNDKGRTWTKYEGNPVVPNPGIKDFRDPKVSWHEATQQWVMIFAAADRVRIYNSPNLIDWEYQSEFGADMGGHGGVWECPDLFELPVEGTDESKWVMLLSINPGGPNGGSATQYFVGDFDGKTFIPSQKDTLWIDYGRDNYAGVTWSDIPKEDGRRLFLGWMSNWDYAQVVPTKKWRSAMTIPRSLHLTKSAETGVYSLASRPVKELESIEEEDNGIIFLGPVDGLDAGFTESLIDYEDGNETISIPFRTEITIGLSDETTNNFKITFDNTETLEELVLRFEDGVLSADRSKSGLTNFANNFAKQETRVPIQELLAREELKLELFIDSSSIEVFLNDGAVVMTQIIFPTQGYTRAYISSDENPLRVSFVTTQLKSIW
ncbi:MAG: glycoside hydrolase family 32 protein [Cytophagia bacterium]|nr:glycoside hydrolase family 32 protein [Cytophagia bacterium]